MFCARFVSTYYFTVTYLFAKIGIVDDEFSDILFYGGRAKETIKLAFGPAVANRVHIDGLMLRKKDFIPKITEVLQVLN